MAAFACRSLVVVVGVGVPQLGAAPRSLPPLAPPGSVRATVLLGRRNPNPVGKRDVGPGRKVSGPAGLVPPMPVVGVSRGHEVRGRSSSVVVVVGGVRSKVIVVGARDVSVVVVSWSCCIIRGGGACAGVGVSASADGSGDGNGGVIAVVVVVVGVVVLSDVNEFCGLEHSGWCGCVGLGWVGVVLLG